MFKFYGSSKPYAVKVIDESGKAAGSGENVKFNINGVFYNRTTNASGIAQLNINLMPGYYIVTAEYDGSRVSNGILVIKDNESIPDHAKDSSKAVTVGNKTVYGVSESIEDKLAFEAKYAIKEEDVTPEEFKFLKLYNGAGHSLLNSYYRKIAAINDTHQKKEFRDNFSVKWDNALSNDTYYLPLDECLKLADSIFQKGKALEEDLVVIRKQTSSLTNYAHEDIYHSDAFFSASISDSLDSKKYGKYAAYVVVPKGTKVIYSEGITDFPREYDIALDKEIDLRLIKQESEYVTQWEML